MGETTESTRINPKHYIGKALNNVILASTFVLGGSIGIGMQAHDILDETPDTTGTEMQTQDFNRLSNKILELSRQKQELTIAQKQHEIATLQNNVSENELQNIEKLNRQFAINSNITLADMFNAGVNGEESSISEIQFLELSNSFSNTVSNPADFGHKINVNNIAYLDECRIDTATSTKDGNFLKIAENIQSCMNSKDGSPLAFSTFIGIFSFLVLMFTAEGIGDKLGHWERQNSRVPRRRKSKKNISNH